MFDLLIMSGARFGFDWPLLAGCIGILGIPLAVLGCFAIVALVEDQCKGGFSIRHSTLALIGVGFELTAAVFLLGAGLAFDLRGHDDHLRTTPRWQLAVKAISNQDFETLLESLGIFNASLSSRDTLLTLALVKSLHLPTADKVTGEVMADGVLTQDEQLRLLNLAVDNVEVTGRIPSPEVLQGLLSLQERSRRKAGGADT